MEGMMGSVHGRFFREKSSSVGSDWCANIVRSTDPSELPVALKNKQGKGKPYYFTVVGFSLPTEDYFTVLYKGEWVDDQRYGIQFRVSGYERELPDTRNGIVKYLSSKSFTGIGKATASAIVDVFGLQSLNVIRETPEKLLTIRGITKTKLNVIIRCFRETESFNTLAVFLGTYGFSGEKISAINKRWGTDSIEIIKNNPYVLCDVPGIGFPAAELIAVTMNTMLESDQRIEACVQHVLQLDIQKGNIYMDADSLRNACLGILNSQKAIISPERLNEVLQKAEKKKQIYIQGGFAVFSKISEAAEVNPARKIVSLLKLRIPESMVCEYRNTLEKMKTNLSEKQKEAVITSLSNRISVITGGPGTGKTTIQKALISCYMNIHKDQAVTLLAPTGRAARRMSESTGYPASTIHSEIHLYTNDLPYGECASLTPGLVVVDEMSMVDQFLFDKLFACMRSSDFQVVLVGDVDQLESVGAGAVLRELIASEIVPVSRLKEVFRQNTDAQAIVENANAVNSGSHSLLLNDRFMIETSFSDEDAYQRIIRHYNTEVQKWGIENVAILCPMRKRGLVCVDAINTAIQNIVNPAAAGEPVVRINGKEFRISDRVIQMKNTEFASNGDTGILTDISIEKIDDKNEVTFTIEWENGNTSRISKEEMLDVDLAYAITVHKSQGSEYKSCIIPVLSSQSFMIKRNLLYTAITRSKEKVVIITDNQNPSPLAKAIDRNEIGKRNTLFRFRLQAFSRL